MAGEITKPLAKAATGDLVTIRGRVYRQVQDPNNPKVQFLEPIDLEAHVNPVSILTGLGIGAIGALALTIAWHGLNIPSPLGGAIELVPGIKDTELGKNIAQTYTRYRQRKDSEAAAKLAQTLPSRCSSARTGILKLRDLLSRSDEWGCDAACQQSLQEQIAVLETFIAENCN